MINYKGTILSEDQPILQHNHRGLHLGDALYEEIKVVNGELFFWEEHYLRLMSSMRIVRMEIPMHFTMEYLETQIAELIAANGMDKQSAFVRITVFREEDTGLFPERNEVGYLISCEESDSPFYTLSDASYEVELYKDFYCNPDMLSNLNSTNRMLSVVGSIYAKENGYQDCLMINTNKSVVQALDGNLFLVKANHIKTPPLSDGCCNGILRNKILEILGKTDTYEVSEASISPFELQQADELFITNIRQGIQPITKYRKAEYKSDVARDLLGKLNAVARLG